GETQGDLPVMIPPGAFLRSGQAIIKSAKFRDGRPVIAAGGYTQAVSYFWFLNVPVNLYHFDAELAACNPSNTVYAWNFGHEQIRRTPSLDWLIEGAAHHVISLTASNALGATRITVPVFAFGTQAKASINNLFERQAFRNALLTMCRAVPADKDPCALWSADLWATLVGVSEPYRGYDILREVFSRSTTIRKALAAPERQFLQDILIGCTRIMAPTNVPVWINRFVEENNDRAAKQHLEMERFDFTLYDIQDIQTARAQALEMQKRALTTDDTLLAQIRMGDVERASGNIEGAARIYSAAQDQYRNITRSGMTIQKLQSSAAAPGKPRDNKRLAEEAHADKPAVTLRATAQSWKTFAVQEAAFLATARNLIQKGYLFEARDILQKWELEVPLCKLNGEFPIAEAEYYIAAQHYVRAIAGLRIYRKSVDISGSLPEAMGLEMTCLIQLRRKQEAAELARDILKRIANHPVAEKARSVLEYGI
ncbi:MAG: hypothetical protein WCL16_12550, partial [bacterium]